MPSSLGTVLGWSIGRPSGRLSFAVPLKGVARRALARLEKLSLSVKLVVTPPGRAALTLNRGVVLHD